MTETRPTLRLHSRCDDHQHMSRPAVVTSGGTVHLRCDMERLTRLLRLARLRRDLLAIAILETRLRNLAPESELRALWGDR